VANTIDPLGGAFFLEALTNQIEAQVCNYFRHIADLGGVLSAIQKGFFQTEIGDSAYRYQREIDEGKRRIIGVNTYAEGKPLTIPLLEMDPEGYTRQAGRLAEIRKSRDNARLGQALDRLRIACQGTENTMPHILDCVRTYGTLGEIVDVMRGVFGRYEEPTWI